MDQPCTLRGLGVAMATPMLQDGNIDYDSTQKLVNFLVDAEINFLVLLGTTGEAPTLTEIEQDDFLRFTIKAAARGRIPIVAGCSGNNTDALCKRLSRMNYDGIDYILSAVPAYNKPSQRGIYTHYEAIAKVSKRPIILYNVPGRTGVSMQPETAIQLAKNVKNIAGIKDASGDLEQTAYLLAHRPQGFAVLSGDDALTLPMMAMGADGVISVIGNILPNQLRTMVHLAENNNCHDAAKEHLLLLDLYKLLFEEGNPAGIKAALAEHGLCQNHLRPPLVPVSKDLQERIAQAFENLYGRPIEKLIG